MSAIPGSFLWPKPWVRILADYVPLHVEEEPTETPQKLLNDELHREVPEGHVLYGLETEVVAVCTVTHKDFVFVTDDESKPMAIVHLTWSLETDPRWPRTQTFPSLEALEMEIRKWGDDDFWM